jgi:hypothetical protein
MRTTRAQVEVMTCHHFIRNSSVEEIHDICVAGTFVVL